jgi:hypothetical protein
VMVPKMDPSVVCALQGTKKSASRQSAPKARTMYIREAELHIMNTLLIV